MRNELIRKGLVFCLVLLLIGMIAPSVLGAQQDNRALLEKNPQDVARLFGVDVQQQLTRVDAVYGYVMYSSAGTGHSIHLFLKMPHLRNSKGILFGGIIIYTSLTALTVVWSSSNGSSMQVVDSAIGPHIVSFSGVGYSTFASNHKGGSGSVFVMSLRPPTLRLGAT